MAINHFCSKPTGPRVAYYVIQSVTAWFGNNFDDYDEGMETVTIHYIINSESYSCSFIISTALLGKAFPSESRFLLIIVVTMFNLHLQINLSVSQV